MKASFLKESGFLAVMTVVLQFSLPSMAAGLKCFDTHSKRSAFVSEVLFDVTHGSKASLEMLSKDASGVFNRLGPETKAAVELQKWAYLGVSARGADIFIKAMPSRRVDIGGESTIVGATINIRLVRRIWAGGAYTLNVQFGDALAAAYERQGMKQWSRTDLSNVGGRAVTVREDTQFMIVEYILDANRVDAALIKDLMEELVR